MTLYPLEHTFGHPNKVCVNCYPKIDMFVSEAKRLKQEFDTKFRQLSLNIRKAVNYVESD